MSAKPSTSSPSPWITVTGRFGVQMLGLAGPVGLDDVGDDDEQREGVRGLRGEQRLRGLAEAGLVGEQEGAVPVGGRLDRAAPGAASARGRPGTRRSPGSGSGMHAGALPPYSKERNSGPSSSQVASRRALGRRSSAAEKSGDEERVGELPLDAPTAARRGARARRAARRRRARAPPPPRASMPAAAIISRRSSLAESETVASSASRESSEVSLAAVLARIVATPSSRLSWSARLASVSSVSALMRARSSRTSRATTWNLVRADGETGPRWDAGLDLADGAGEHRDDALVVAVPAGVALAAVRSGCCRTVAGLVWPRSSLSTAGPTVAALPRRPDASWRGGCAVRRTWLGPPTRCGA